MNFNFKLCSSLEKIFTHTPPSSTTTISSNHSMLLDDKLSFVLAYTVEDMPAGTVNEAMQVCIKSDLSSSIRQVQLVPSQYPVAPNRVDDNYITTSPGLFPDILVESDSKIRAFPNEWNSVWIDLSSDCSTMNGAHLVEICVLRLDEKIWSTVLNIDVIPKILPEQSLMHTQWFHADCLADYYGIPVWSQRHWEIIENFIATATKNGINMMLTPIFTPPLDTQIGGERTTVQLVDVTLNDGIYSFDFAKLERWIMICSKHNVKFLEMAHLFTQWGAKATPKIMVSVDNNYKRLFGWDVPATSDAYKAFLSAFLPALDKILKLSVYKNSTFFHVSDEPRPEHMDDYLAAKALVVDYLKDYTIIDALSSYEFYKTGAVEHPIPANNHIDAFIEGNVPDLWTYYCCSQTLDVSNRFFAMPSARNRIIGVQMYLYNIKGFLHWGYNFYNSQYSAYHINPFLITDAAYAFPSGDTFLVYPAPDGSAIESIRIMVFAEALRDLRALQLLENLVGRDKVLELINQDKEIDGNITFSSYPKSPDYILNLRDKVNAMIKSSN